MFPIIRGRRSPPRLGDGRDANLPPGLLQGQMVGVSTLAATFVIQQPADFDFTFFVSKSDGDDDFNNGLSVDSPWETINKVNAQNFAPSTSISLKRGDTWVERLLPPTSGIAGKPIAFLAYGPLTDPKPIIGAATIAQALRITDRDYLSFVSIEFKGTKGTVPGDHLAVVEQGSNYHFMDCDFRAGLGGNNNGQCFRVATVAPMTDCSFTDCTFETGHTGGWNNTPNPSSGVGGVKRLTFLRCAFSDQIPGGADDNDLLGFTSPPAGGAASDTDDITITDCTFTRVNHPTGGDFLLDITSGKNIVVNNCTFDTTRNGCLHIAQISGRPGGTSVVFNDCDFANSNGGWATVRDDSVVTFERCNFHDVSNDNNPFYIQGWKVTTLNGPDHTTVICKACSFIAEAGSLTTDLIRLDNKSSLTLDNCSLVMRNAVATEILDLRDTNDRPGVGLLTIRNTVLDSDTGVTVDMINETHNDTVYDFDITDDLFETFGTNGWFDFNDEPAVNEGDVGPGGKDPVDDPGNITGPPDFNSENDAAANYLLPNAGSPLLEAGDPAFAPLTDLKGVAYGPNPNIGCRAGSA